VNQAFALRHIYIRAAEDDLDGPAETMAADHGPTTATNARAARAHSGHRERGDRFIVNAPIGAW